MPAIAQNQHQNPSQNVALSGVLGSKALVVINGAPPKMLSAGQTHSGVKVISASGDQAVLEIGGKRVNLRVGEAPVSSGSAAGRVAATKSCCPWARVDISWLTAASTAALFSSW